MRTAESYSQGLPSVGRAAQQELLLPRKLIIFNPGRRKERGEGEGLREKRRGWQRRGEDGEAGRARGRDGEQERGAREGRAGRGRAGGGSGRDCSQRQGQWEWGKPAGSGGFSGRGLDVERACHPPLEPLWFLSQASGLGAGVLLRDPPQATQPGLRKPEQKAAPSWVSPTQGCAEH